MIQGKVIRLEFKKSFNKRFFISIIGLTIFLLCGIWQYYNGKVLGYSDNNAIHAFLAVIENNHTLLPSLSILMATMVCGDSLYNEYKNGHLRNLINRIGLKSYIVIKCVVNMIISAIVIMIPMLIMLIVSFILFDFDKSILMDSMYYAPSGKLGELYNSMPIVYILVSIGLMGVFVATYSTLSIGIAFYAKFRSVALILPLLTYNILQFGVETIGNRVAVSNQYRPMSGMLFVIFVFDYQIFAWYALILTISTSLVYFKLKRGVII